MQSDKNKPKSPESDHITEEIKSIKSRLDALTDQAARQQKILDIIAHCSSNAFIELDTSTGMIEYDNQKLFELFGVPHVCRTIDYLLEITYNKMHADDRQRFLDDTNSRPDGSFTIPSERGDYVYRFITGSGRQRAVCISIFPLNNHRLIVRIADHVYRVAEDGQQNPAAHDSMTGAVCLQTITDEANRRLKLKKYGVAVVFSLEHFELIVRSDEQRYEDEALSVFIRILTRNIRQDDILARTGNYEYTIFISGPRSRSALSISLSEISQRYREYLADRGISEEIRILAGVAIAPEDGSAFSGLYGAAKSSLHSLGDTRD